MVRQMIKIDADKCNGCGICVNACHEGALGMIDGKAVLLRDDYCDGLGNCLPACPTGAITFELREAPAFDKVAVEKAMHQGCPGTAAKAFTKPSESPAPAQVNVVAPASQLRQWPVQIKLVPVNASYFSGAHLLVAADCCAFAYGDFHNAYMKKKVTLIGCPKLDEVDYTQKLTAILQENDIKSVTVARMEVPCCGGLEYAVKNALQACGKMIPWQVVTITTDGQILD